MRGNFFFVLLEIYDKKYKTPDFPFASVGLRMSWLNCLFILNAQALEADELARIWFRQRSPHVAPAMFETECRAAILAHVVLLCEKDKLV